MTEKVTLQKNTQTVELETKDASVGPSVIDLKNSLIFYPQNLWIRLWINNKNLMKPNCGLCEEKLYIFYTIDLFIIFFNYL